MLMSCVGAARGCRSASTRLPGDDVQDDHSRTEEAARVYNLVKPVEIRVNEDRASLTVTI